MITTAPGETAEPTLTRNESASTNVPYAPYVPHDLKYSASFEDSLIDAILGADFKQPGIRIIPDESDEDAVQGESVRYSEVDFQSLPHITEDELPLPLHDTRRIFASPISGIKLTHPGGYLEGGPGLDPEMDTFPDDFLSSRPQVTSSTQLQKALQKEINSSLELLKERVRARQKAKEKNEQIEKEIKLLKDTHDLEIKVRKKMQEDSIQKKEAKGRRRKGK